MKMTRKLIPALAMLLISAVMLSTASFAWFSMNATVTATGMQIEAKSDQTFLLISATNTTADTIQQEYINKKNEANAFTATTTIAKKALYPAAVATAEDALVNDSALKFHYAAGTSYENGTANGGYTVIRDLTEYVVKHTFYITVIDGAIPAENIVVKSLTINGDSAVHVVVTSAYAAKEYEESFTDEDEDINLSGVTDDVPNQITDQDVLAVNVYIFYDGDETNVTTANAATLQDTSVEIVFGVKGATQN